MKLPKFFFFWSQFLEDDFSNDDLVGIELFEIIQSISNQPRRDWEVTKDDAKILLQQESEANLVETVRLFGSIALSFL